MIRILMAKVAPFCRFLLALFCLASAAFAQSDRGTLTGTITDPQGAVIPSAKITALHGETGAEYGTVSTPTGNYTIAQLPPGGYSLTVDVTGFTRLSEEEVAARFAAVLARGGRVGGSNPS